MAQLRRWLWASTLQGSVTILSMQDLCRNNGQ